MRKNNKLKWSEVRIEMGGRGSISTYRRILRRDGQRHWRAAKRILLRQKSVKERLDFVEEWKGKEEELTEVRLFKVKVMVRG
jgi:hypothetical protein